MFSKEVIALLKEVISSWQVIAISVALIFYLNIVFYAARAYHAPKINFKNKISFKRKKSKTENALDGEEIAPDSKQTDELGLEEA